MTGTSDLLSSAIDRHREGRFDEAVELAAQALAASPDDAQALSLLGSILSETGRRDEGLVHLARAFDLNNDDPTMALAYGKALREEERFAEAEAVLARAAGLAPEDGGILAEHGMSLRDLMRLDEAEARLRAAVALPTGGPRKFAGLGLILFETGRPDESAAFMAEAAKRLPDDAEILTHLALALQDMNRLAEAEGLFRRVLALAPKGDHEDARRQRGVYTGNLALNLLAAGKIAEGWDLFEARAAFPNWKRSRRAYPAPLWQGENYDGKTLLAWREQGLGDEIRFGGCAAQLAARGGQLVLDCDPRLESLYKRSFPEISVREAGPHGDLKFDLHVPIASLPRYFRRRHEDFPGPIAYLKPDPKLVEKWQARLKALPGRMKIGICWKTGVTASHRLWNISSLESWAPLFRQQDACFVNLQYGDCVQEIDAAERAQAVSIHGWPDLDLRNDLEDIVALMTVLDLVVTVGTAVNDLAGAAGAHTWLILKTPHYDMMGTGHYPWYPNTRVFTRPWNQDWPKTIARVAMALKERMGEESGRNAPCPCGSGKRFKHCCGIEAA